MHTDTTQKLAQYITGHLLNRNDLVIEVEDDLLGSGLLDSLSVMSLVHYIEEEMHISVPPDDVVIENFMSLACIDRYIASRAG